MADMTTSWIRLAPNGIELNLYADFRGGFTLPQAEENVRISVAADSDFLLYLDGVELGGGQFSDYPDRPTATEFTVGPLEAGEHLLAALVWFRGKDFSTYRCGTPGFRCELAAGAFRFGSSAAWKARLDPAFRSGPIESVTTQLGFVTFCDGRKFDNWQQPGCDDSSWETAVEADDRGIPAPRPVPRLVPGKRRSAIFANQGFLLRPEEQETFAATVSRDLMRPVPAARFFGLHGLYGVGPTRLDEPRRIPAPTAPENGSFVILDLGGECAGRLEFELDAPAGTVVDLSHGEHLDDGRVRSRIRNRNFTDRYICHAGRNRFAVPFRRSGCRCVQLNFTQYDAPLTLHYAGLRPQELPLPPAAPFDDGDGLHAQLRKAALNTMKLCIHEHYEDCPWREQALYAYDSRNQALFGYYAWGNYEFAATSIELLGRGIRADGLLELCAPARVPVTIPIFSWIWFVELYEQWLYSGNDRLFRLFECQMDEMLDRALARRDNTTGLCLPPESDAIWNFYEWAKDLDGNGHHPLSALYNLYLALALRCFEKMKTWAGEAVPNRSDALLKAVQRGFRRPDGFFATYLDGDELIGFHEHTNILALLLGLLEPENHSRFIRLAQESGAVPVSISVLPFAVDALHQAGPAGRRIAAERLIRTFEPMLFAGTDTLWEVAAGSIGFDGAGSLCHAWSSVPIYWQGAYQLGVRPLEPGFARFAVSPCPGTQEHVAGEVPAPSGPIRIDCRRTDGGFKLSLECPPGLEPEFLPLDEFPLL